MQHRESDFSPRSRLEALLARQDDAALDYVTRELMSGGDCSSPPAASGTVAAGDLVEAG